MSFIAEVLTLGFPDVFLVSAFLLAALAFVVFVLLLLLGLGYTVIGWQGCSGRCALFLLLIGPSVLQFVVGRSAFADEASARQVGTVCPLDHDSRHLLLLTPQRGGDGLVRHLGGIRRHEAFLHLLSHHVQVAAVAQHALSKGKQNVQAVNAVATHHGHVHGDQLDDVWLWHTERMF